MTRVTEQQVALMMLRAEINRVDGVPDADMIRRHIADGADVNAVDENGITPLISAAANGDGYVVAILLDAGADPAVQDCTGTTALVYAASAGSYKCVEFLLQKDSAAHINLVTNTGENALITAVRGSNAGFLTAMCDLIRAGIDTDHRDHDGHDYLWHARERGHSDQILDWLARQAEHAADRRAERVANVVTDTPVLLPPRPNKENKKDHGKGGFKR